MELPVRSPPRVRYTIEAFHLSYELPSASPDGSFLTTCWPSTHDQKRTILKDVTCQAHANELTAIVGPSGAGKSTLLSILAGSMRPRGLIGGVLVNGREMDVGRYRRLSGHVTQDDDSLFPHLTVRETLMYSARLRLRATREAAEARVRELVKELGLEDVVDMRVGGGGGGGVSGGERRRVSIGVELVHDPAVLLLDEPTSGLDSASALQIVAFLKTMAFAQEKTIVLTIHQPGFRIVDLFNRIILISGGAVCHNASLQHLTKRLTDAGHRIPPHINILDYAMDTITTSQYPSLALPPFFPSPSPALTPATIPTTSDNVRLVYANSHFGEIAILGQRFFKNILRTNQLFTARILQSIIAGVGLGSIFMHTNDVQSKLGFFAFTLTFLLSSTVEGLPIFLQERTILTRETTRGAYRISSYVVANTIVFLPFLLAVALLYSTPVYWMIGLRNDTNGFLYFSLVIWLVVLMANSFVSCFSALVPNFIMGNSLIAGFMGSFFLFSGYFIPKESIPNYWVFMHYLSLFKYPFEALLVNEYGGGSGTARSICVTQQNGICLLDGRTFLRNQGVEESKRWINLGVMAAFVVGYRILCFAILWFRCHVASR